MNSNTSTPTKEEEALPSSPFIRKEEQQDRSPVSVTTTMYPLTGTSKASSSNTLTAPRYPMHHHRRSSKGYNHHCTSSQDADPTQQQRDDDSFCNLGMEKGPFFLMDWLEELVSQANAGQQMDAHQLAELLKTPDRVGLCSTATRDSSPPRRSTAVDGDDYDDCPSTPKSSNRKKKIYGYSSTTTPSNSKRNGSNSRGGGTPLGLKPKTLFQDASPKSSSSKSKHHKKSLSSSSSTSTSSSTTGSNTSMRHSQLTLGNGWNAKGLKKAQQGLWKDALACWDMALRLRLPILSPMSEEVANTWNNRGIALGKLGQYERALNSLDKALKIRLYNNRKKNQNKNNSNDSSKGTSTSSSSSTMTMNNNTIIISTYHNIANVHQQKGDYGKALEVFGHAKSLCYDDETGGYLPDGNSSSSSSSSSSSVTSSMVSMARICSAMGHVYYQAEQWIDARDAYWDAVQVYDQLKKDQDSGLISPHVANYDDEVKDLQKDIKELDHKVLLEQQQQQQQQQ